MIPKIFHHVWLGSNPFPLQQTEWLEGCKKLHPDWDFMLWNDENTLPLRDKLKKCDTYAAQADIVRVWAVMNHGGVYADTDFEWYLPIDDLLNVSAFCGSESKGVLSNGLFGAEKNHPWLKKLWSRLDSYRKKPSPWGPMWFTRNTDRKEIHVYPTSYFYPYLYTQITHENRTKKHKGSYCVHHWAMSWHK